MPISYHIDRQFGVARTTARGVLTEEELLAHKRRLLDDPFFGSGMVELSDVRGIDRLDVTPHGIRQFVAQDAKDQRRLQDYKLAIVASEDVVYGMARMYQALTGDYVPHVAVFRDPAEAATWLGQGRRARMM